MSSTSTSSRPASPDATLERLEDQIGWYSSRSKRCQRFYKSLKTIEILAAAAIPVITALGASTWIAAALGGLIVALEGVLQLNQYQSLWINYRATAEALKHEKYLFAGEAGPYTRAGERHRLLAERIESLISQEDQTWLHTQRDIVPAQRGSDQVAVKRSDDGSDG
jgi:uncharacterized protein DUF4231